MGSALPLIDVERLQVGMYVVLDVGWRNHPFLRSSFTLRTPEQVAAVQETGLRQVRWCPERSTAQPLPEAVAEPPVDSAVDAVVAPAAPGSARSRSPLWTLTEPPTELQWQRLALERVEAEYEDVASRHRELLQQLASAPAEARQSAELIGDVVLRSVVECDEPAVRLLSQQAAKHGVVHEAGVAALAVLLGHECGLAEQALRELSLAALLHDIGKLKLPAYLRHDAAKLTEAERQTYRRHVALGVELAEAMGLSGAVIRIVAEHHERYDGSGFPHGLAGDHIAAGARMLAVVDRYMQLVSPPYADGLTPHQAMQHIYANERGQFDPTYLAQFVRVMGVYPPGSLVELSDHRMAVVVASRPGAALAPRVQIIETPNGEPLTPVIEIDPDGPLRVRGSVAPNALNSSWAQRSRQLARAPIYVEPQSAPEWAAWSSSETEATLVF